MILEYKIRFSRFVDISLLFGFYFMDFFLVLFIYFYYFSSFCFISSSYVCVICASLVVCSSCKKIALLSFSGMHLQAGKTINYASAALLTSLINYTALYYCIDCSAKYCIVLNCTILSCIAQ